MIEEGSVITQSPKMTITCPYRFGGPLVSTLAKNFVVSKHLGWLAVGETTEISRMG